MERGSGGGGANCVGLLYEHFHFQQPQCAATGHSGDECNANATRYRGRGEGGSFSNAAVESSGPGWNDSFVFSKILACGGERYVTSTVKSFFRSGKLVRGINHTHITMVPKVKCPMNMTQLRPVSLCNVVYKILSKVLANRPCTVLPTIISESQGALVTGRYIMDNILIGQEVLHRSYEEQEIREGV